MKKKAKTKTTNKKKQLTVTALLHEHLPRRGRGGAPLRNIVLVLCSVEMSLKRLVPAQITLLLLQRWRHLLHLPALLHLRRVALLKHSAEPAHVDDPRLMHAVLLRRLLLLLLLLLLSALLWIVTLDDGAARLLKLVDADVDAAAHVVQVGDV